VLLKNREPNPKRGKQLAKIMRSEKNLGCKRCFKGHVYFLNKSVPAVSKKDTNDTQSNFIFPQNDLEDK